MLEETRLNTPERDELVMTLVELALTRRPEERERYLRSACVDHPQVFQEAWKYVQREQRMKGFLLEPLLPRDLNEQPLTPGDLLLHRFRIVGEVARGGMGVVYNAWDEKLERRIAIKCAKAGFRKRLPPEVRNASAVSHPNVCKIFEIHSASVGGEEIDFLTMEFLEGETLTERLRRGPVGDKQAKIIALQLCEGLAEAHRNQVIHGDLKCNNVILTTEVSGATRAVITDFGLARRPVAAQFEAQPGHLAGTPDYMAPELLKGGKAWVASDIYALGVILHELATGRHPMPRDATYEERLVFKPEPVNHPWNSVIQRCLDPDPEERFPSTGAVALALAPPTRRWLLAVTVAVVLSFIAAGVTYWRTAAPVESVRLAVLPFRSGAADVSLRDKMHRDVIERVKQLKGDQHTSLKTTSRDGILRSRVDSVENARAALDATHVLHGTIEKEKDQVKLRAFLTDSRSKVNVKEWSAMYGPGEERYIPVALASIVTGALRLPPLAAALNATARSDYTAGLGQLRRDSTIPAALASFERAVQADPDSPLAYAGLAEAQWFQYFMTKQRLWLDRSAESARQAERRNTDFAQVHRVAGLHLANGGFYEHASAEYRRAIELQPGEAENYRRLGQACEKNSQKAEALTAFQTAVTLQPDYHRAHLELGAYYYNRGDYLRAVEPLKKAVDLAPDEPNVRFALGGTYLYLGMYSEAEQQLRIAVAREEASRPLHSLGLTLMYQARDKDAIEYFSRALSRTPDSFLSCMYLGIAYRRTNQIADATRANRRGLELTEAEMAKNPRDGYVRAIRGYFGALLGDRVRAESETAQALTLAPDDAETRWVALLTYESMGLRDASLAVLSSSSRLQLMDISRWPDLALLHHDSRFLQLLATFDQN